MDLFWRSSRVRPSKSCNAASRFSSTRSERRRIFASCSSEISNALMRSGFARLSASACWNWICFSRSLWLGVNIPTIFCPPFLLLALPCLDPRLKFLRPRLRHCHRHTHSRVRQLGPLGNEFPRSLPGVVDELPNLPRLVRRQAEVPLEPRPPSQSNANPVLVLLDRSYDLRVGLLLFQRRTFLISTGGGTAGWHPVHARAVTAARAIKLGLPVITARVLSESDSEDLARKRGRTRSGAITDNCTRFFRIPAYAKLR